MTRQAFLGGAAIAALAFAFAAPALAADGPPPPPKSRVSFAKGASSATIKGTLKGDATIDYLVNAAAGQTIEVKLEPGNTKGDFIVIPAGSPVGSMFSSFDTGERRYSGVLPSDGDYSIRVFLNRAAARRNEVAKYVLTVAVSGRPLPPLPAKRDAKVGGTAFHATGMVKCVPPYESTEMPCDAGVVRRGSDGTATVELRGKNPQVVRHVLFVQGKAIAADAADPVSSERKGDLNTVKVGEERYEIPDAFLTGG